VQLYELNYVDQNNKTHARRVIADALLYEAVRPLEGLTFTHIINLTDLCISKGSVYLVNEAWGWRNSK
jgi:hypothetical protein